MNDITFNGRVMVMVSMTVIGAILPSETFLHDTKEKKENLIILITASTTTIIIIIIIIKPTFARIFRYWLERPDAWRRTAPTPKVKQWPPIKKLDSIFIKFYWLCRVSPSWTHRPSSLHGFTRFHSKRTRFRWFISLLNNEKHGRRFRMFVDSSFELRRLENKPFESIPIK